MDLGPNLWMQASGGTPLPGRVPLGRSVGPQGSY